MSIQRYITHLKKNVWVLFTPQSLPIHFHTLEGYDSEI